MELTLFDNPKNSVFPKLLVFCNIFGFPAVNWAQKWTKTINFQSLSFEPNFEILKDFSNNVFVLLDYFWSKFEPDQTMFWGIKVQKSPQKGAISESIQETLKIFNFTTTYAIMMKLTTDTYLN